MQRFPDGTPPVAGVITGRRSLVVWRDGAPEVVASVEQYAGRALATPHGIVVLGPRTAVLVRPSGARELLATVPDHRIALSADGRTVAIAGVDLRDKTKFMQWTIDLASEPVSVSGEEFPMLPRAVLPEGVPAVASPGAQVRTALASGDPFVLTDTEGTPLTENGMRFGPYLSPSFPAELSSDVPGGRRWLYGFRQQPPVLSVTEVTGDELGSAVSWPLPPGCATASGGNRCPVWEDSTHLLLVTPHDTVPDTRAIRVDVTTGAIERVEARDVEVFVEPWVAPVMEGAS